MTEQKNAPGNEVEWHVQVWFPKHKGAGNWFTVYTHSTEYIATKEYERRTEGAVRLIKLEIVRRRDARE